MNLRLAYRSYRLPFRVPVRTAHGIWAEREGLIVRLEGPEGVRFAEVAPIPGFGRETVSEDADLLSTLGAELEPDAIDRMPEHATALRGALKALLSPLEMPTDAKPLGIAALLPSGRPALDRLSVLSESGFRVFKWKVGVGDPRDEQGILDDLCSRLPSGARLRLDANGAWDRRVAERWLGIAAERPVEFIEQPVRADHRSSEDLLLGLAADFPTPIALDESLVGDADVERWLSLGWLGVFVVKPSLCADPVATLARLAAAKSTVVFSSALETAVGAHRALTHAFGWAGKPMALGFGVWPLFQDSRWDGPLLAPFLRPEDVQTNVAQDTWTALS